MEWEHIEEICLKTSDSKCHVFLQNEGWRYDSEETALAGYGRLKKSSHGSLLTEDEFLEEIFPVEDIKAARRLYHILRSLAESGALTSLSLYQYARFKWCISRPEAIVACQTGPKRWEVNNCAEAITEDRAKVLLNSEFGFEVSRLELLGTPYYGATDWNFIRFRCGRYDWLMRDSELYKIYQ